MTDRSDFQKFLMGVGFRSAQPLLLNILSLPAMALIIRKLGSENYGKWCTSVALVSTSGFLTSLGLRGPFVREVARNSKAAPSALSRQLSVRIPLTLLAMAMTLTVSLLMRYPAVVVKCTAVACAGMLLSTLWTAGFDLLDGLHRFAMVAWISLAAGLVLTAASVVVVWFGGGPVAVSVSYLLGHVTSLVLLIILLRPECFWVRPHLSFRSAISTLWESRHFTAQTLLAVLKSNLSLLVLPKLIGAPAFGHYAGGTLLASRSAILPDALGTVFYPILARAWAVNRQTAARRVLKALVVSSTACTLAAIAGTLMADWIGQFLFPHAADECALMIRISVWVLPLLGIESMIACSLNACGREAAQAKASVPSTGFALAVGLILCVWYRAFGACWFLLARSAIQIAFLTPAFFRTLVRLPQPRNELERAATVPVILGRQE